jgi:hypothetical protein
MNNLEELKQKAKHLIHEAEQQFNQTKKNRANDFGVSEN